MNTPDREAHQEAMRRSRERQRQLLQEARFMVPSRLGPAINGILWRQDRPEVSINQSPQTPILSIIEFSLKPGVDLRDESRTPRKLLDAALGYIRSIRGCRGIEWGLRLDVGGAEAGFFCLIYWNCIATWHKFQHSLGFTPLVALLASDVSNRCARFGRSSGMPGLGEAVRSDSIIDAVSVTFSTQDVWSQHHRVAFEQRWNALVASLADGSGRFHSHGMWLENNASTFDKPTTAEIAAATALTTFTSFLFWDGANYDARRAEHLRARLQASLHSPYGNLPPSTSRKSIQLMARVRRPEARHPPPPLQVTSLTDLASILGGEFTRQCSTDLLNIRQQGRENLSRSIREARARTRLFPQPRGDFISQGELHEGNMSAIPEGQGSLASLDQYLVDIVWMQLKGPSVRAHGPGIFNQVRNNVGALPGLVRAYWARDVDDETQFAVLLVWASQQAQQAILHECRRMLDYIAASSDHISSPPTYQTFPIARHYQGVTGLDHVANLELVWFRLPPGALERQLFEYAYGVFARMAVPLQPGGIFTALTVRGDLGGWQPADATERCDSQTFTAALSWMNPAARLQWYHDLVRSSFWSYELFGHKLDALKVLATGGVSGRFLAVQRW